MSERASHNKHVGLVRKGDEMAKDRYGVMTSLNRGPGDHEIRFSPSLPELMIKSLVFWAAGGAVIAWATQATFISGASLWLKVLFVLWGLSVVFFFGRTTKTKELVASQVPVIAEYLPRKSRRVNTRTISSPTPFYSVTGGLDGVDEDGVLSLYGGAKAKVFRVVGSASYLLFDEDRVAIVDRYETFLRKLEPNCDVTTVTTSEPQRIHHQLANLERRNRDLVQRDPDLIELQNEFFEILTEHVGSRYTSTHQYLIVTGDSADALNRAVKIVEGEATSSSLVFRELVGLDRAEVVPVLQMFFQGIEGGSAFSTQGYGRTPAERAKAQLSKA